MKIKAFRTLLIIILLLCQIFIFACSNDNSHNEDEDLEQPFDTPLNPPISITDEEIATPTEPPLDDTKVQITPEETPIPAPIVEYAYYLSSTTDGLSVRSKASTNSTRLGFINKGDMLSFIQKEGNWYKTIYKENAKS